MYDILSIHALVNLANVVNGASTRLIGERSEPQIRPGSLVNLANLVYASEHYQVLDMNDKQHYVIASLLKRTHI